MQKHVAPSLELDAFNCPYCGAFSYQEACAIYYELAGDSVKALDTWELGYGDVGDLFGKRCQHCRKLSLWAGEVLMWPRHMSGPDPNADLPDDARQSYNEARAVAQDSPRAAAALLRLALQQLFDSKGAGAKTLDEAIVELVRRGLPDKVSKAADIVRVVGNNAVHPGEIEVSTEPALVEALFHLINDIAYWMLTKPRELSEHYSKLPENARDAIDKRNARAQETTGELGEG